MQFYPSSAKIPLDYTGILASSSLISACSQRGSRSFSSKAQTRPVKQDNDFKFSKLICYMCS